jgi:hypothetical protein
VAATATLVVRSPTTDTTATTDASSRLPVVDSDRWIPLALSTAPPYDARRLGSYYLFGTPGGVAKIDEEGVTTHSTLAGLRLLRGVASDGETAVAFGLDEHGPSLWTTTDAVSWTPLRLPWQGTVQAVAVVDDGLAVIGIDAVGGRQIAAHSSGTPDAPWNVQEIDGPDSVLVSTGDGFVGRGRLGDGPTQYLHSSDGVAWTPFADIIVNNVGELAAFVFVDGLATLRIPGDERVIRPPGLPVSALWRVEERIWVQTPTAAWWSEDGSRWSPLPIDRAHGIEAGAPVLLPFPDRAMLSVGGTRGVPRETYVWILGS